MKVKITSDSTCDLSQELLSKHDIEIIPLTVHLGEVALKDGTDMDPEDIYAYVEANGMLPRTGAVNVFEYEERFRALKKEGFTIIHFCLGSKFSSSFQNAMIAATNVGGVIVIDSQNLSNGQGFLVLHAAECAELGMDPVTIADECNSLAARMDASFIIDSIDYLHKGGRCSAVAAFGANLLHLKPTILVQNGIMTPDKKYRGAFEKVAVQYVRDKLANRTDIDVSRIFITHTKCDDGLLRKIYELVQSLQPDFKEIIEMTAGSTITTHCGPNSLGLFFLRKA